MHLLQGVPWTAFIWTFNFAISIPFQAHWSKLQFKSNSLARAALGRFIIIFLLVFAQVKFKVIINLYVLVLYWDLPNFVRMSPLCKIVKPSFVLVFVASLRLSLHQPRQLLCVAPHPSFVKSKCNIASCASHYHNCRDFLMCQGFAVVHHYDWNLFISLNFYSDFSGGQ